MLDLAEQGKLGGTLKGSRPEGNPVPRPFGSSLATQGAQTPPPPKSHKPSGVSLSPKGDLGDARQREVKAAFPRQIKRSGGSMSNPLSYRKPSVMNDYGDRGAAL
jgi:hypothetical protein